MSMPFRSRCSSCPLSAYVQGGEYAAPQGAYKEENDFVPVNKVLSMTPAEFFNTANALMQVNPPADADEELLKNSPLSTWARARPSTPPSWAKELPSAGRDASGLRSHACRRRREVCAETRSVDLLRQAHRRLRHGVHLPRDGSAGGAWRPTPWTWRSIPRQRWWKPAQR